MMMMIPLYAHLFVAICTCFISHETSSKQTEIVTIPVSRFRNVVVVTSTVWRYSLFPAPPSFERQQQTAYLCVQNFSVFNILNCSIVVSCAVNGIDFVVVSAFDV